MKTIAILLSTLLLTQTSYNSAQTQPDDSPTSRHRIAQAEDIVIPSPQEVQQTAKEITVRVTSANNGGSGVIIAQKGNTYLVLTNAHVTRRATQFQIQAPDGQKYTAKPIDGGFNSKSDLALLQFTSQTKYTLADLSDVDSPLTAERDIYSAGFPFDSKDIRITSGKVSQLSDIPFDNGTQIGYTINKGEKGIRQGMSGGAILDGRGKFLGINTIGAAPILPNYTYNDGSKPLARLSARYREANWGIPVYNFLIRVKPDILSNYQFSGLKGEIQHQVNPTGYMAKLNDKARQMTVRIETGNVNGSGVIIAKEGNSYYVLTAKHVVQNLETNKRLPDPKVITYDQDIHNPTSTIVAEGVDLAVVKFTSTNSYPLAQIGTSGSNNDGLVFVGGFPGRGNINSPLWQWQLNPGFTTRSETSKIATQSSESFSNGYDSIYTSISHGGMSGGPVIDPEGRVIGIHGRGESTNKHSLGISIQTFIGLAGKLQVNPQLLTIAKNNAPELNEIDRKTVVAVMQNISQPQEQDDGKIWLAYADRLHRTLQFSKSVIAYDKAIAKGEVFDGNYGKALSLSLAGKPQLAEVAIGKAIAIIPNPKPNPNPPQYNYVWKQQNAILQRLGKYNEALKAIDTALKLDQNNPSLLNEKAAIFSLNKQYPAAIAIYDRLIKTQPEAYIYVNLGITKLASGDPRGAILDHSQAIELNPNYANAYSFRGNAKSRLGDNLGAISDHDRAIKIDGNNSINYYNRGIAKYKAGDKQGAIEDFDRAIAIDPEYAAAYYNRGTNKADLKDFQGAIADYDLAIKFNPTLAQAYTNRGMARSAVGLKQEAIEDYNKSIELNSTDPIAYYNRGRAKSDLGNKQGAIEDYDRAIVLNPKDTDYYYNRGMIKHKLGDKQGAISDYNAALKLNPKLAEIYQSRGLAKLELRDKQGAITDFNEAIKIDSSSAEYYFGRGLARSDVGDKKGAIEDYSQVIKLNPKFAASIYMIRGATKSELGDKQGAISDVSLAAELFREQGRVNEYQKAMGLIAKLKEN
jgi:tetratricopeptide (TPR) repeat protein